jgi:signal peptidase I
MRPGFAVGGVVISERVPVSQLMVRDVIVFRRPDKPSEQMVHRIIKLAKGGSGQFLINTQGDANTVRDPWTLTILGKHAYRVRWSLPLIGYAAVA